MAIAYPEVILPLPNPLWDMAADWVMVDLQKGLSDPKFPKKLHEALWWGNVRWAIILALGFTGTAVAARNYFFNEDRSNALPLPEPKSTPLPTEKPTQHTASSTPYPTNTELPPTPKPLPSMTFTLPPTETPTPTATPKPTKEAVVLPTLPEVPTPFTELDGTKRPDFILPYNCDYLGGQLWDCKTRSDIRIGKETDSHFQLSSEFVYYHDYPTDANNPPGIYYDFEFSLNGLNKVVVWTVK